MEYSIGEIAKLFGLSKEAIRHYERLNIIDSKRNPVNNYRYYDEAAVSTLRMLRGYRALNFSLEEAISLLHSRDIDDMLDDLINKEQSLKQELELLNQRILTIYQQKVKIQQFNQQLENYHIDMRPSMLWFSSNQDNLKDTLYQETELFWTSHMPNVRISARYIINQGKISCIPGFCISSEDAEKIQLQRNQFIEELPSCRAIRTLMTSDFPFIQKIDDIWINKLLQYEKDHGLQTSDEILSAGIVRIGGKYYFEIWHPLV